MQKFNPGLLFNNTLTSLSVIKVRSQIIMLQCEPIHRFSRLSRQIVSALQLVLHSLELAVTDPKRFTSVISSKFSRVLKKATSNDLAIASKPPAKHYPEQDSLPIVLIHGSNSDYLKFSLGQAKASNPRSNLFLLGDASNNVYDFVEHHFMDDYCEGARQFENVYRHYSTNGFYYELFCFQRWFILRDFLRANKIRRCLYLDSDTMLYTDVTQDSEKFSNFDFTISHQISGCTFFLNRVEALVEFCQFLMDIYTKKDRYSYDKMVAHYAARKRNGLKGGVSDMTVLQLYGENHFGEIGEVAHIIDGSVYDPSITWSAPGFEMENGIKKIVFRNGLPYGKHLRTGTEIRFNSLQFQGPAAKRLMSQYYTGDWDMVRSAPATGTNRLTVTS